MYAYMAEIRKLRKEMQEAYAAEEYTQAAKLARKMIQIYLEYDSCDSMEYASDMHNLAVTLDTIGLQQRALDYYKRAAILKKDASGETLSYADTLNNLAIAYNTMNDTEHALQYHKQTLTIRKNKLGEHHIDTIHSLFHIGNTYEDMKSYTQALQYHQKALELARATKDFPRCDIADILASMAGDRAPAENENGVKHDIHERARDLRDHRKEHIPARLVDFGEDALAEHADAPRTADGAVHDRVLHRRGRRCRSLGKRAQNGENDCGKERPHDEREQNARAARLVCRLRAPLRVQAGHLRVHAHARSHRQRGNNELNGIDDGERRQSVSRISAYEKTVYDVIERLNELREHDGRRDPQENFPDGFRSEKLPVRPPDCVKTLHNLPRNVENLSAFRQTCNSIVSRPRSVKRKNSPAAEIP